MSKRQRPKPAPAKSGRLIRKAERLGEEIQELVRSLYNTDDKDIRLRCENLKTYRVEVQRSFILYTQLAIEDLLRALLFDFLARSNPSVTKKELIRTVDELKSAELVHWCGRLRRISLKRYKDLLELNRIRNACAHNWLLDIPKYKKTPRGQPRKRVRVPVVTYHGKNLLDRDVFLDDFYPTYGRIYLALLGAVWKTRGII